MANNLMALDAGTTRVGVAVARADIRIPMALTTLSRIDPEFWLQLKKLVEEQAVGQLVIGLPRGLDGQETPQTTASRVFGAEASQQTGLPLAWQDEALTSVEAEANLKASGKAYSKADIDAHAAQLILADYLNAQAVKT
ncbi:MAG TPA: Holliday junction resolvase RuvX [Patescibacteria group bacterium]|nr:Holliday junction resolvase RuvX [Patescibacteria group bacterium]